MKNFGLLFLLTVFCFSAAVSSAQTLPRKAALGVSAKPLDEAEAKAGELKIGDGLVVLSVVPDLTFAELGIKTGDIILSTTGARP